MVVISMTKQKKTMLLVDIVMILISCFIFLYLSPSTEVRQRMIYIIPQTILCMVLVIVSRLIVGVYKEYFHDVNGGMYTMVYIHLIIADVIAGVVFYLVQLIIPEGPIRITFIRVVSIILFNLMESIIYRLVYQSGYESGKDQNKTK